MRQTLATRPLTFRVPIANEEERALFQRRLGMTGLVVFLLSFGFFVVTLTSLFLVAPDRAHYLFTERSSQIHLATAATAAAVWVIARTGKRTIKVLSAFDLVLGVGICLGWSVMAGAGIPLTQRPEMIAILAVSFTLVLRAALIPSTPARTAIVGVLSFLPLVGVTFTLYGLTVPPDRIWALPPALEAGIWGGLGVSASTVISYVIYGLRQQVRKATQLGQYLLEDKIGEGGMGVVYRASHAMLRRPTAIKLLSANASQAAERFEREVQITARLTHPNTVAIFDYGRTPDGIFYYAMEYLDGISLEDLVGEHGAQPARRVAHLLLQMCGALNEAHASGLVHRDIKPANVMLTERGGVLDVVKVLDFGLVKERGGGGTSALGNPAESLVTTIMGTPHYMAPEAILDPSNIDGRADLYALGVTAYYLLTGKLVFEGTNLVEVCSAHLHEVPKPPSKLTSDVPPKLERVILACLAKKATDCPKDATTLATMIKACGLGEWTQDEAREWWASHQTKEKTRTKAKGESQRDAFGDTVAVALDDRNVA